jgi:ABC-type transport system involved in cytochrome bd biosynthesis fused ATPase/permease subunit
LPLLQGSDVRVVGLGFHDTATASFEAAATEEYGNERASTMAKKETDMDAAFEALRYLAHSITAKGEAGTDATGGIVMSLTEAVMGVTAGLVKIANAIDGLADSADNFIALKEWESPRGSDEGDTTK